MNQPQLLTATRILEHTMPVTSRRLLLYGAITLALLVATLAGAGTFFGLASFSDDPGFWGKIGAIAGLTAAIYGLRLVHPQLFHQLELIHLAAMAKRIRGENLPSGKQQLDYLHNQVQTLFPTARDAFGLRCQLRQVIADIFSSLPPGNRLQGWPEPLRRGLAALLLGFSADALMAVILQEQRISAWRRGVTAFCQHYQQIFRHALIAQGFLYAMLLAAFWLLLKPVGWVDEALPTDMGIWKYVFAAILTYWIKTALLNPIITAAMMLTLFPLAQKADETRVDEWQERIPALSQLPGD